MAACYSFVFTASRRPGKENSTADALSHFDFQGFHQSLRSVSFGPRGVSILLNQPISLQ